MRFEENVHDIVAIVTGVLVFLGCWGGITVIYGPKLGGYLGWIPALVAGIGARHFWPYVWAAGGIAFILYGNIITATAKEAYERFLNPS